MAKKKGSSRKSSVKSTTTKAGRRKVAKRELIDTGRDTRFVRRDEQGFKESDDVGKSLAQDRRRRSKTAAKSGQGDKGDRKKAK